MKNNNEELTDIILPNNKVLVSVIDTEEKSHGGIILHSKHIFSFKTGIVLMTGPGKPTKDKTKIIPMQLSKGDVVLINPDESKEVSINFKKYNIFDENKGLIAKIGEVNQEGEVKLYADTKI